MGWGDVMTKKHFDIKDLYTLAFKNFRESDLSAFTRWAEDMIINGEESVKYRIGYIKYVTNRFFRFLDCEDNYHLFL